MYNCIACGADMGLSILSLCEKCSAGERAEVKVKEKSSPRDVYKSFVMKRIASMIKEKPRGVFSHGNAKIYNTAITDVLKMIQKEF